MRKVMTGFLSQAVLDAGGDLQAQLSALAMDARLAMECAKQTLNRSLGKPESTSELAAEAERERLAQLEGMSDLELAARLEGRRRSGAPRPRSCAPSPRAKGRPMATDDLWLLRQADRCIAARARAEMSAAHMRARLVWLAAGMAKPELAALLERAEELAEQTTDETE
ncbi:MAG TPA: hypothetical protein VFB62_15330 [Polyangiaceae bacterium]|nr:hypothetical protein [Polyangiaceae bacterium]